MSDTWLPIPLREHRKAQAVPRKTAGKSAVTTKTQLSKHTKEELIDEVFRLQNTLHDIAAELGLVKRAPSSPELTIDLHFVGNITTIVRASWANRL